MTKVLVVGGMSKGGGISELIRKYYTTLSRQDNNLNIDILIESGTNDFKQELMESGINCYYVTPLKKNPIKYFFEWKKFLRSHDYDYIHVHSDNYIRFAPYVLNKHNADKVIVHSHNSYNSDVENSKLKSFIENKVKHLISTHPYKKVACSQLAAHWLFDGNDYEEIYNGIDVKKFVYDVEVRDRYREKLGYSENDCVIGHVGRFEEQKNHYQLIDIFENLHKKNSNFKLLMIGNGSLKDQITSEINKRNLSDSVRLIDYQNNINDYLNVMDMVVFPSLFEGFPIFLIEAQANGLPVFYSNSITQEVEIIDSTKGFSLQDSAKSIAQQIIDYYIKKTEEERLLANNEIIEKGFDISTSLNKIKQLYEE